MRSAWACRRGLLTWFAFLAPRGNMRPDMHILIRLQHMFLPWVLAGALLGWWVPAWFVPGSAWIAPLLALVMFFMGLAIPPDRLAEIRHAGRWVALGVGLQYLVMPLAAWGIAQMLALPPELALGVVLLGSCPGGTASNVVAYLAGADVALSVAMTTSSTLLAPVLTPLWTWGLAGTWAQVDGWGLLASTAEIVLGPVLAGLLVRRLWGAPAWLVEGVAPLAAIVVIAWIVAVIVALNHAHMAAAGLAVWEAVVLLNAAGLFFGYLLARLLGADTVRARTIAIEVGMQNSGLAAALATKHFGVAAALAGALFSLWHNVTGPLLASWWRRHAPGPSGDH